MKRTANEILFGTSAERTPEQQELLMSVLKEMASKPEFARIRTIQNDFSSNNYQIKRKPIRNFGEQSALEAIGLLAVWLTQLSDEEMRELKQRLWVRRIRRGEI